MYYQLASLQMHEIESYFEIIELQKRFDFNNMVQTIHKIFLGSQNISRYA